MRNWKTPASARALAGAREGIGGAAAVSFKTPIGEIAREPYTKKEAKHNEKIGERRADFPETLKLSTETTERIGFFKILENLVENLVNGGIILNKKTPENNPTATRRYEVARLGKSLKERAKNNPNTGEWSKYTDQEFFEK
jgi:hypothetical protein